MDIIELERGASEGMEAIIAGILPSQWSLPTPCPDWAVADLVRHVIAGNVKYAEIGRGVDRRRGAPDIDIGDDPVASYQTTFETMLESWQKPGALDREITLPRGRGRAEEVLFIHLGEALVHGWDLATAISETPLFDDAVVEASLARYMSWLPPQRPPDVPFGDAVEMTDGATPIERLAACLGRDVRTPTL